MNHPLSEAKVGDVFRITDAAGESRDAFFAGAHKNIVDEDITTYNFLYWGEFSQRIYKAAYGAPKDYKWQTSDFFIYKEKIIQSLAYVEESHFSLYYAPLMSYSDRELSQKPWLVLCGYQFETADINRYLTITKLEEANPTQTLHQPVLPKRKEVIIHG